MTETVNLNLQTTGLSEGVKEAGAAISRVAREEIAPAAALIEDAFGTAARAIERDLVRAARSGSFSMTSLARSIVTMDTLGRELATHRHSGQPLGLAVGADGRIYLGDADNGSVTVYDAQWHQLQQLGQGVGEFQMPGHIALLMNGATTKVFVSDGLAHRVKAYRNGLLIGQYGSRGQGPQQLDFPTGLWVSADRQLFVVDQNNDRVQVLDENGNFLRWFGLTPATSWSGRSGRAQGIMGDGLGRLYVADTFQGHIKVFDLNGDYLGLLGGFGNGFGQMQSPAGLALDLSGRLWVANLNGPSVQGYGLECFQHLAVSPVATTTSVGSTVTLVASTHLPSSGNSILAWRTERISARRYCGMLAVMRRLSGA